MGSGLGLRRRGDGTHVSRAGRVLVASWAGQEALVLDIKRAECGKLMAEGRQVPRWIRGEIEGVMHPVNLG